MVQIIGKNNWGLSSETLKLVDASIEKGLKVTIDQYPYTASQTSIRALIPQWAQAGGRKDLLKRIEDPKTRTLVDTERQFLIHVGADCSNAVAGHATYEQENIRLRTFLGNEETNQNTFDDRTGLDGETLGRDAAKALTVIGT